MQNLIFADNTGGNCNLVNAAATSNGFNLYDDGTCAAWMAETGDQNDVAAPIVEALDGQRFTRVDGGPAVDAVPEANCVDHNGDAIEVDQRGEVQPNGAEFDVGAVEK